MQAERCTDRKNIIKQTTMIFFYVIFYIELIQIETKWAAIGIKGWVFPLPGFLQDWYIFRLVSIGIKLSFEQEQLSILAK